MAAKQSTNTDHTALQQLRRDLKAGTPACLYFFYGEETWLRDSCIRQLKDLILPAGLEDFNLHSLYGKDCTPQTLSDCIDSLPMMSERSLVLVWDYDIFKAGKEDQEAYAQILGDLPEYVCTVFIYDTIQLDRRTFKGDLGKLVKGSPALVQFSRQDSQDLIPWIQKRLKPLGKTIPRDQAEYLIFVTGGMMSNLSMEIEKLGAYAKGTAITKADIDAVCEPVLDAVVFQMTDSIAQGNFQQAAAVLSDLLAMEQPGVMILGALGKQVRELYTARVALENGKGSSWLQELWGLKSSWVSDKLLQNARRLPGEWYRTAVKLVAEADRNLKLTYNGDKAILSELLARLAEAAKTC